jgi:hypothetical protein
MFLEFSGRRESFHRIWDKFLLEVSLVRRGWDEFFNIVLWTRGRGGLPDPLNE